ncbi:MAG: glycosyltransferase family 2 protein [Flavobacteriales bacterium]|nr:glycosyltransferase family 2 protein [Flavobacteriales bacterium]
MALGYVIFGIYVFCLFCILIYSLAQSHLTFSYLRSKKQKPEIVALPKVLPHVTIQLPIYNELYVVERLLRKVAEMDYPTNLLEIQVLDDSTDETVELTSKLVSEIAKLGINIKHIRRPEREGFKAGALAYGLKEAKGEFIAIFDADFLPEKDFFLKTLPFFKDEKIGLVQTKWEHLNKNYNVLTRLLGMALDAHFTIEQKGRNSNGDFMNFNGTAGVWRRECIETSGGWSADTLTEDLDLSYRSQLKGWKMKYVEEYSSPAEIPAFMQAVRSQQYRWNKGGAEVARKNLGSVLKADLPFHVKFHAFFHLLNSGIFLCVFLTAFLSVPLLYCFQQEFIAHWMVNLTSVFYVGFGLLFVFYWVSLRQRNKNAFMTTLNFIAYFPIFLSLSMGLSLFNSIAVIEGYLGVKSPFVRTPKFNIVGKQNGTKDNQYARSKIPVIAIVEGLLVVYFGCAIWFAIAHGIYGSVPYHLMLVFGFSGIFFYSVKHSVIRI